MAKDINVTVPTTVKQERIDDLLCCAFEGGSTYWCHKVVPSEFPEGAEWAHETLTRGATLTVSIRSDYYDETDDVVVTPDKLGPALQLLANEYPKHMADVLAENEDADTGDVFFQLLCFGEVVYG